MNQQSPIKSRGNPAWVKGVSGNPAGRPVAARQKLSENLITAMAASFEEHGAAVLNRLVAEDPGTWAKLAYAMLPRDINVKTEQTPAGIDRETWEMVLRLVDVIRENVPEGVDETQVLAFVEHSLRAEFAKPIIPPCPIPAPH
jgi:hypothetical protein